MLHGYIQNYLTKRSILQVVPGGDNQSLATLNA